MVRVWDTGTSASVCVLAGHTNSVTCVAFSSNGQQLISGSWDGTVRIWDVSTGVEVHKFTHIDYLNCIALSPNGHQLALASWKGTSSVQVWDVSTREAVHNPATQPSTIDCCAFSPSGLQLATADADGTVWIWDSRTGVPIGSPLCHSDWIASMDYRESQGQLLLVATHWDDWILTVWNMSVTPPSRFYDHVSFLRDPDTPYIPPTSSHSPIDIDRWRKRTFISTAGISFYLPSSFRIPPPRKNYTPYSSHEGRIAYGGKDGSVIIIDCSHLLPNSS
jgi:WD40 repeat protein